mgnify:CR=1 FL=1
MYMCGLCWGRQQQGAVQQQGVVWLHNSQPDGLQGEPCLALVISGASVPERFGEGIRTHAY